MEATRSAKPRHQTVPSQDSVQSLKGSDPTPCTRIEIIRLDLDGLSQIIRDSLQSVASANLANAVPSNTLVESEHQIWFKVADLVDRWKCKKTKIYEIPNNELPSWKRGNHKRFFWAHVLAYEGRITREQADVLHNKPEILQNNGI